MRIRRFILTVVLGVASMGAARAAAAKSTAQQLTSIFENSTPILQYTFVSNIGDQRGYTFGFAGFTSGTYSGTFFLEEYQALHPGNALVPFLPAFRKIDRGPHDDAGRNPDTTGLGAFPAVFASLGNDPLFRLAQVRLVDRLSWIPAQKLAARIGARYPLTQGELYDAYVNHGEDGIRPLVARANQRAGGPPAQGVSEAKWLAAFLRVRLAVLKADSTWVHAIDRIAVYQKLLNERNYRLRRPLSVDCYGNHFDLR